MCQRPRFIKNRSGNQVLIHCGSCTTCKAERRMKWSIRLLNETIKDKTGKCLTLTLNNKAYTEIAKSYPTLKPDKLDKQIAKRAMHLFLERWRKQYGKSLKHWFLTEPNQNEPKTIQLHGIAWTKEPLKTINKIWGYNNSPEETPKPKNIWSIKDITRCMTNTDPNNPYYRNLILTSKGIGKNNHQPINEPNKTLINPKYNGK